ncbi:FtsX-like permease family protein [Saccharomonospora xinjiangensis]|uniref:ABC transporter permease n=1 Tax=Saccharomonospora xinjiangensis TaxID=75294 RepID=UPI00107051DC|nr:FtsX-like permease family protein [Saccharomonospora xinjiangensis]QBQ59032.1 FtsX-like permease family protein [Saccharomonospora xinjiangensis]
MFVAWRDLRFARGRFALVGTVLVLITVLVGLLSGLTAGLGKENTSAITGLPADHLAFAAPLPGEDVSFTDSRLEQDVWRQWKERPGVVAAEPVSIGMARATSSRAASVAVFGVEPGSGVASAVGGVEPGSVVLSESAAEELGAAKGTTVTLADRELTVRAVTGDASYSHTPVVWTVLDGDAATVVALTTEDGADLAGGDRALGTTTLPRDEAVSAIASYQAENGSLQVMRGFLFGISALVVGAFFTVWTMQRRSDVAVLKALGASNGYLLKDALGQALVVLVAGTAVGTAITVLVGTALAGTVPFVLDPVTVGVPSLIMIGLGLVGAALSLRHVTSVDPLTALGGAR